MWGQGKKQSLALAYHFSSNACKLWRALCASVRSPQPAYLSSANTAVNSCPAATPGLGVDTLVVQSIFRTWAEDCISLGRLFG